MNRLSVLALAAGLGVSWGLGMLFAGWAATFGWGAEFVKVMGSFYIGFEPSVLGAIIGAVWGLVDGAIGGAIIALVYNVVASKQE